MENLILLADAYKYSHHKLYYPGTSRIYSYLESRGGKYDNTVFYGLQYYLKKYLQGKVITTEKIDEAETILHKVFGRTDVFDRTKFDYIVKEHNGHLPVEIKAVPEGQSIPYKNVLMTIENTDPNCYWLPNFLETLLMQIWYPSTVATISREVKKVVRDFYQKTASKESFGGINFVLNDFGLRGVSSVESAGLGGSAHLLNFMGSDNLEAIVFSQNYYKTDKVFGMSVPATEHSICTLLGEKGELDIFKHVLNTFPTGIIACVSDSFNIFRACEEYWGTELKDKILNREGKLVIRPDSGDPIRTLLEIFNILFDKLGYTVNEKGYKVLPPQVSVIQGDGVNYDSIKAIYVALEEHKISAENLVLGMGGALLQKLDRDTQKYALKCSYAEINGEDVIVQKSPTEMDENGNIVPSFKKSKGGKLKLVKENNTFATINEGERPELPDLLETVFKNGEILKEFSFEEIRNNASID